MSQKLIDKLKDLRNIQREMDWLKDDLEKTKAKISQMIIRENKVGKKFHLKDRYIVYKKTNIPQGLSQVYVSACLEEYFHHNPREAEALMRFILDNRSIKSNYKLEITQKNTKKVK